LDDLLNNVSKADSQFSNVNDDIRCAFQARVTQVEEYTSLINNNILYYATAILDPRIKSNLIQEQYGTGADEIILQIREYLKQEY
jgi:hypothetical protein